MKGLEPDEMHVRYSRVPASFEEGHFPSFLPLLSEDELARYRAFHFNRHRQQYLVAHALLRLSLSEFAPVAAPDWRFERGPWGKPSIANPLAFPLDFNLAHTSGLVACVIAPITNVGIDVEDRRRGVPAEHLSAFLAPWEVDQMFRAAESQRARLFFDFWTLKESYMKARGLGMAIPLDQFGFDLESSPIRFTPEPGQHAAEWSFYRYRPTDDQAMAVAVKNPDNIAWQIRLDDETGLFHNALRCS